MTGGPRGRIGRPYALGLYFLGYGKDYRKAIADFTRIAGKIPLPPAYVFGYWYSKYASYSADDYRGIMADLESNGIPADAMILARTPERTESSPRRRHKQPRVSRIL